MALLGLLLILVCPQLAAARDLATELERFVARAELRGATLSVAVGPLQGRGLLLAKDAERALVPASNQKVLLASAALAHFGPAHRFTTAVHVEGGVDAQGVVPGRLWVVGGGDPSLVSERAWKLAEAVRLAGVREIRGGLGVDARLFDREHWHPDWIPISRRAYHAPISAFSANYSSFRIDVRPAAAGSPAALDTAPRLPYFRVRGEARTIARPGRLILDLGVLPDGAGERVRVSGTIRAGAETKTWWRSVSLPEHYAAALLREQLRAHGIVVADGLHLGELPENAPELLRFEGATLAEIVRRLNKYSNNYIAEMVLKSLGASRFGAPGSFEKGARAIRAHLSELGLDERRIAVADGSGLSPRNRVSARDLVEVIRHSADAFGSGPEFLSSLPLAGREGTLEERMENAGSPIRGKTGHLSAVSSLSGVLPDSTGRALVFSVLVNGASSGVTALDAAIDEFVSGLASAELGPEPLAAR